MSLPSVGWEVGAPAGVTVSGCSLLGKHSGLATLYGLVLINLKKIGRGGLSYKERIHYGVNSKQTGRSKLVKYLWSTCNEKL